MVQMKTDFKVALFLALNKNTRKSKKSILAYYVGWKKR